MHTLTKELRDGNNRVYFTIEANKKDGWLHGTFHGPFVLEQMKSASMLYLEWLQRTPYKKILDDKSRLIGSFLDANQWLERVCFPAAIQAGLTCFAYVLSDEPTAGIAVADFNKKAGGSFYVRAFDNIEEAEEWLRSCK